MPTHRVSDYRDTAWVIGVSFDRWVVDASGCISPQNSSGIVTSQMVNSDLIVKGIVDPLGPYSAISSLQSSNLEITIGAGGFVSGQIGIDLQGGTNSSVVNHGTIFGKYNSAAVLSTDIATEIRNFGSIRADTYGLDLRGASSSLYNDGSVRSGFTGAQISGAGSRIINDADGKIIGDYAGVVLAQALGEKARLVNHGLVESGIYGIIGSNGMDTVRNDGVVRGAILLGKSDDIFDTRSGKIDGEVRGGVGDDIFITDNAKYKLVEIEGEGEDIVRSTVSYTLSSTSFVERLELIGNKSIDAFGSSRSEYLTGNSANNRLTGAGGLDRLDGKSGNDVLKGGAGDDRFVFKTGYDRDVIVDFHQGADEILVSGWKAIDNFADVKRHAHNDGADVVIQAGQDSLTIRGLHKQDLHASDFDFIA